MVLSDVQRYFGALLDGQSKTAKRDDMKICIGQIIGGKSSELLGARGDLSRQN